MKKIAFIGGTRFIGHHAAQYAIEQGHKVLLIHRGKHPCEVDGADSALADRRHPSAIAALLSSFSPDVVVDTLAMAPQDAEDLLKVLQIFGKPIPLIVLSSQDIYRQFWTIHGHPCPVIEEKISESSALVETYPSDHGWIDYDKRAVENIYRRGWEEGILSGCTILRLPATYGPRDPFHRFQEIVDALMQERELPCKNHAQWKWTHAHVRDVARAILLSCEKTKATFQVFNVAEDHTPTMQERVEAIAGLLGKQVRWKNTQEDLPSAFFLLGQFPCDLVFDDARIREIFAYHEITTAEERLQDLVAHLSH